jgi:hypothetical protein
VNAIWVVPVVVAAMGGAALFALLRGTSESARELVAEVARFGEMHAAVGRLRSETQRAGEALGRIQRH